MGAGKHLAEHRAPFLSYLKLKGNFLNLIKVAASLPISMHATPCVSSETKEGYHLLTLLFN